MTAPRLASSASSSTRPCSVAKPGVSSRSGFESPRSAWAAVRTVARQPATSIAGPFLQTAQEATVNYRQCHVYSPRFLLLHDGYDT